MAGAFSRRPPILGMRLDVINNDVAERLNFTGSAANTNCALRTLRRLLHKAEEWKLIRRAPKIKLLPEKERSLRLDDQAERKLLTGAAECNWRSGRGLIFHTSPIWCLIEEPPTMYPSVSNKILSLSRQSSQIMAETLSQEGKSGHDVL